MILLWGYLTRAGIPIEIHAEEKVYIPEMIFGELLTSSNYDDSEKKVTGGMQDHTCVTKLTMLQDVTVMAPS